MMSLASLVWIVAIVSLLCTRGMSKVQRCSNEFQRSDYTLIPANKTWCYAYEYCKYLGLELAVMETTEEADFVTKFLQEEGNTTQSFWIGASDLEATGFFKWLDGGVLTSDPCLHNETNGTTILNCRAMLNFEQNDTRCDVLLASLCEQQLCRSRSYTISKDHRLLGHALETVELLSLSQCVNACTSRVNCKSVNFEGSLTGAARATCELNGNSSAQHLVDYSLTNGYTYAESI